METIKFKNNINFRHLSISYEDNNNEFVKKYYIYELIDENVELIFDNIKLNIISIIDDKVLISINDSLYELNMKNSILNIENDVYVLKINIKYAKPVSFDNKLYSLNENEYLNYYKSIDRNNSEYLDALNYFALNISTGMGLSWIGISYVDEDDELAYSFLKKANNYSYYNTPFYLGRFYFYDRKYEEANYYLEKYIKGDETTINNITAAYEFLSIICNESQEFLKEAYYTLKAIKLKSATGWALLGNIVDRNVRYEQYLPSSDAYAKYCYLEGMKDEDLYECCQNWLNNLSDVEPIKPNFDYVFEFEEYILSSDYIDPYVYKRDAIMHLKAKEFDAKMFEDYLLKLIDFKWASAGVTYSNYFMSYNENGVDTSKCDNIEYDTDGSIKYVRNDPQLCMKYLNYSSDLGATSAMLQLISIYSYYKDSFFDMELARKQYDRLMLHMNNGFDDVETEVLDIYKENISIYNDYVSNLESEYLDEYISKPHKSYLKQYFKQIRLIEYKKKFIKNKGLKELPNNFIKANIDSLNECSAEELINNAIYYMTIEYNEYLAYHMAYMAYDLGNEYAKYILGVIYELGIFTPRANSYAKYFYEMVAAKELGPITHIKSVKPNRIISEISNVDPQNCLLEGLKLISIGINNMPNPVNMEKGLELIKLAIQYNYPEAFYILGGLYFDIEQDSSRLWDKGSLIHLEANKYYSHQYLIKATEYGHEDALLVLSSLHAYKHYPSNKITNLDPQLCQEYINKLAIIHQYPYLINIGCESLDNKFNSWWLRFYNLDDFILNKYAELNLNGDINEEALANLLIAINCKRLAGFDYFYGNNKYFKYLFILQKVIEYYFNKKRLMDVYYIYLEIYKLGLYETEFDDFIKIKDLDYYEVKYYLTK